MARGPITVSVGRIRQRDGVSPLEHVESALLRGRAQCRSGSELVGLHRLRVDRDAARPSSFCEHCWGTSVARGSSGILDLSDEELDDALVRMGRPPPDEEVRATRPPARPGTPPT